MSKQDAAREKCILNEADSGRTTESMLKVANDALDIGELLGLKVIGNKENALKRITCSLKTQKIRKRA